MRRSDLRPARPGPTPRRSAGDRRRLRAPSGALVAAVLLLLGAAPAAALVLTSGPGVSAAPEATPPPGEGPGDPPPAVGPGQFDSTRDLYLASCSSCHGQDLAGTQRGPSLVGVGEASVDFQLRTGRMPLDEERTNPQSGPPLLAEPDIEALVAYIGASGDGPPIPSVALGDVTRGRELYLQSCAACHSATGTGYTQVGGVEAPSLLGTDLTQVAEAVRVGPGLMPAFPSNEVDQDDLEALLAYVDDLQQVERTGGTELGRVGPVAETLVGFAAVALLLLVIRRLGKRSPR